METSPMLYYQQESFHGAKLVDFQTLSPGDEPLRYEEFSIVDSQGFSKSPSPGRVVQSDPRTASVEIGKKLFELSAIRIIEKAEGCLRANE